MKARAVVSLNELKPDEVTAVLNGLVQHIIDEKFDEIDPRSEEFWRAWERSFEAVRSSLFAFTGNVRFTIRTPFFNVELKSG